VLSILLLHEAQPEIQRILAPSAMTRIQHAVLSATLSPSASTRCGGIKYGRPPTWIYYGVHCLSLLLRMPNQAAEVVAIIASTSASSGQQRENVGTDSSHYLLLAHSLLL
jgi:hypothetical protein